MVERNHRHRHQNIGQKKRALIRVRFLYSYCVFMISQNEQRRILTYIIKDWLITKKKEISSSYLSVIAWWLHSATCIDAYACFFSLLIFVIIWTECIVEWRRKKVWEVTLLIKKSPRYVCQYIIIYIYQSLFPNIE